MCFHAFSKLSDRNSGWSSAKKSWCCTHRQMGCPGRAAHAVSMLPGDHSGQLTKSYVTHVTQHMGPTYTTHHHYSEEGPIHVVHHYDGTVGIGSVGSLNSLSSFTAPHGARRLQEDMGEPFEANDFGGEALDADAIGAKRLDLGGEPVEGLGGEFLQDGVENSWHEGHYGHYDPAGLGLPHISRMMRGMASTMATTMRPEPSFP